MNIAIFKVKAFRSDNSVFCFVVVLLLLKAMYSFKVFVSVFHLALQAADCSPFIFRKAESNIFQQ